MNDLEIICVIKRELILKRREIEAVNNLGSKDKALKAYAEFLTGLEMGKLGASHKRAPSWKEVKKRC